MNQSTIQNKIEQHRELSDVADKLAEQIADELNTLVRRWLAAIKDDPGEKASEIRDMIEYLDSDGKYKTKVTDWSHRKDHTRVLVHFGYDNEEWVQLIPEMISDPEAFFTMLEQSVAQRIADKAAADLVSQLESAKAELARKKRRLEALAEEMDYTLVPKG